MNARTACRENPIDQPSEIGHAEPARPTMLSGRSQAVIFADLRSRVETARLDLLVLFRALDRMDLTAGEIFCGNPFELGVDYAEALWALDQPPSRFKLRAMLRHTLARFGGVDAASGKVSQNASIANSIYITNNGALGTQDLNLCRSLQHGS